MDDYPLWVAKKLGYFEKPEYVLGMLNAQLFALTALAREGL